MIKKLTLLAATLTLTTWAHAQMKSKTIEYKEGKTTLEGVLVFDDQVTGPAPGVIVVHDWMGPGAFTQGRAEVLAKMGYIVFTADIYGKGVRPKNTNEAMTQAALYKNNRPLLRARAKAALETLLRQPQINPKHVAAIGYCFGGTTVLEMARSGAPLVGVVSFHGGLSTPNPLDDKIQAKVLVLHGADDPHVPAEEVAAFEKEMNDAKADWQLVKYSGAVHAFAVPSAGNDNSRGAAYNPTADRRSWQAMKDFFNEVFL